MPFCVVIRYCQVIIGVSVVSSDHKCCLLISSTAFYFTHPFSFSTISVPVLCILYLSSFGSFSVSSGLHSFINSLSSSHILLSLSLSILIHSSSSCLVYFFRAPRLLAFLLSVYGFSFPIVLVLRFCTRLPRVVRVSRTKEHHFISGSLSSSIVISFSLFVLLFFTLNPSFHPTDQNQRAPVNLAVSLDRSGLMAGEKLKRAKEAVKAIISNLGTVLHFVLYGDGK